MTCPGRARDKPRLSRTGNIKTYMTFIQELECDTGDKSVSLSSSELANGYTLYAFKITDGLIGPAS